MGNSGSNKIHSKAESERLNDFHHSSLQRVNPKAYNGGFKVLPERLPNQRLRQTDNGSVLHNGGTLSGRRPTSISGIPDSSSGAQPPPLPPPLTEEELNQLLKKRHQLNQQHRHSNVDVSVELFGRPNYIPKSTQSNIDFRLSKPRQEQVSKKKLFNRKSKAPSPPFHYDDAEDSDHRLKKPNKRDFANFFNSKRNSTSGRDAEDHEPYLLPPPSQFVSTDVINPSKIDPKDKKSITYVLARRDASISPSSDGHRSSMERNRHSQPTQSSPDVHKYGPGSRMNNHPMIHGQLSDGGVHSSTLDRMETRHKMGETLQKRVKSMDSLVHNGVDGAPNGGQQLHLSARDELKAKLSKMSKTLNQSVDNLYLQSKNEFSPPQKSYLEKMDNKQRSDVVGKSQHQSELQKERTNNSEATIQSNMYNSKRDGAKDPFVLSEAKTNAGQLSRIHHNDKFNDDEVFEKSELGFGYNQQNVGKHLKSKVNRHQHTELPESAEEVSEHVQEAFFAKTRETRTGVLEYNRKIGSSAKKLQESDRVVAQEVSSEDDMDIDMQLRPTLPKRHLAVPRFSPTHVWRSLIFESDIQEPNVDDRSSSIHSSDAEEEGYVYEDRIQLVARPMAPPKSVNEKSADSGISPGAVSPLPVSYDFEMNDKCQQIVTKTNTASSSPSSKHNMSSKLPHSSTKNNTTSTPNMKDRLLLNIQRENSIKKNAAWTPEEDLASDFDAGSGDIPEIVSETRYPSPSWGLTTKPEMISSHPKLTSRKEMFSNKLPSTVIEDSEKFTKGGANVQHLAHNDEEVAASSGQTFNSVRKLKRSLSGVIQNNIRNRAIGNGGEAVAELKPTSLDDNWSLSRSLPNSLHNGHEGERLSEYRAANKINENSHKVSGMKVPTTSPVKKQPDNFRERSIHDYHFQSNLNRSKSGPIFFGGAELSSLNPGGGVNFIQSRPFTDLEGLAFNTNRSADANKNTRGKNRVMYLPKYEAMQIIDEKQVVKPDRRAYSDLGTRTETNIPVSAPKVDPIAKDVSKPANQKKMRKGGKKFTYQSTVRQHERKQLEQKLSREVALEEKRRAEEVALVNKVEEEFQKKRDREKVSIRQQLRILNLKDDDENNGDNCSDDDNQEDENDMENDFDEEKPELMNEMNSLPWDHSRYPSSSKGYNDGPSSLPLHIPPADYDSPVQKRNYNFNGANNNNIASYRHSDSAAPSKFFGGISRWMKKQPTKEENGMKNYKSSDQHLSRLDPEGAPSSLSLNDGSNPRQPSPQHESRGRAITGAKFSSGRSPDITFGVPRKGFHSQVPQAVTKNKPTENLILEKDSRTSVWLSPDNTYPSPTSPSKIGVNNNYYQMPFDALEQSIGVNGKHDYQYYAPPMSMGPSSMPFEPPGNSNKRMEDENKYFHGGVPQSHDMMKWKSTGGQRHSIAIDTSSGSSHGGGESGQWVTPDGFRNPNGSGVNRGNANIGNSRNVGQNQMNGHPTPSNYHKFSYSNPNGGDYRKEQNSPGLNSNHRSLSFSHIPGMSNGGQTKSSKIPVPNLAQPYNPNKAYRPVPFYTSPYHQRK